MRRRRLFCTKCGARKSKVSYDKKRKAPVAVCDADNGGCGASIPLFRDEYGMYHPTRDMSRA